MDTHFTKPVVLATMVFMKDGKVVSSGAHSAVLEATMGKISDFSRTFGEQGFQAMFAGTVPQGEGPCFVQARLVCSNCGEKMAETDDDLLNLDACRRSDDPAARIKKYLALMCEEVLTEFARAARIAEAIEEAVELAVAFSRAASRPEARRRSTDD